MRGPSPFWVVQCPDCSGEQTMFSRPSTSVNCSV
ncbi:MAG: 30S ribosomal protein S27e, partial [Candidatus Lutacidiplasmatales archaeon]